MRFERRRLALCAATALLIVGGSLAQGAKPEARKEAPASTARILFIGNSHTYFNDLPTLVAAMGASKGIEVIVRSEAPGGYEFGRHVERAATLEALKRGGWDFVVLQESGRVAAETEERARDTLYPHARTLIDLAREHSPGVRVVLYLTHGYRHGAYWRSEPELRTYAGHQARIERHYRKIARETGAEVAPAGLVWRALLRDDPDLPLHHDDDIHPSPAGSLVSAAVLLRTMFAEAADVVVAEGVRPETARALLADVNSMDLGTLFEASVPPR